MYDLEYIESVIRAAIENRGIDYTEDETPLDLDSMQFISMIVEFEETLNITIDDDHLLSECFSSFINIKNTLIDILEKNAAKI